MDDALRGAADAVAAMTHLMTGQHREAFQSLGTVKGDGPAIVRARAEALLGIGKALEALDLVEQVIARAPRDAIALELAARCCAALGRTRDATKYAKAAERLGRPEALAIRASRRA
jgi:predicted Zn-dependent protease